MNLPRGAYLQTIRKRLRDNPIVALVGPRQAGKTTLARMLAASWRRCTPLLRLLGLAALSVHGAEQLHLHVQGASWERRSQELVEQKLRAVEARKASLVDELQRAAKGVAALPEALSALGGGPEAAPLLFEVLESCMVPGGAPTFHRGLGALMEVVGSTPAR